MYRLNVNKLYKMQIRSIILSVTSLVSVDVAGRVYQRKKVSRQVHDYGTGESRMPTQEGSQEGWMKRRGRTWGGREVLRKMVVYGAGSTQMRQCNC